MMKTLGKVLIDAQRQFREGAATCGMAVEETLHEAEHVANAVLAHAIANAEPVGFLVKETGLYLDKELDGDIAYYRASGLTLLPHFTVPQPLPQSAGADDIPEDTIDRLMVGKATEGDQMLVYNALTQSKMEGAVVSVDVSTGEHDISNRIFARIIDWQEDVQDGRIYLAVEEGRNFAVPQPLPSVDEDSEEAKALIEDAVSKALRRAWQLGQTYWQQADSDSWKQRKKADVTQAIFYKLVDETLALLKGEK